MSETTRFILTLFFILILNILLFAQQPVVNEHSIKFNPVTMGGSTEASLVGEDGLFMKTTDGGVSWTEYSTNLTNVLYSHSYLSGSIIITVGENGVILKSTDNGENWTLNVSVTTINLNDIEIFNTENALICGDSGVVFLSTDEGGSWSQITSGTNENLSDINFISQTVGFITGDNSTLLKTTNGGLTWEINNLTFGTFNLNSVYAVNEDTITVVGDEGRIFSTIDGGEFWFAPSGISLTSNINDVLFFNDSEGILVGDDALILRTTDGGATWEEVYINAPNSMTDFKSVSFSSPTNGIIVGKDGAEIYSTDGGENWYEVLPYLMASRQMAPRGETIKNLSNYPNPFNPSTSISYQITKDASVSLKVYDLTGKEVANIFSGNQKAGNYTFKFDSFNLSSGVYFYVVRVNTGLNETSKTMKMILTK